MPSAEEMIACVVPLPRRKGGVDWVASEMSGSESGVVGSRVVFTYPSVGLLMDTCVR
jgi:hypothetical protein